MGVGGEYKAGGPDLGSLPREYIYVAVAPISVPQAVQVKPNNNTGIFGS